MSVLEFIKLIHCSCIKKSVKVKVVVGQLAIFFISLGNTKQEAINVVNYNYYVDIGKKVVPTCIPLYKNGRGDLKVLNIFANVLTR